MTRTSYNQPCRLWQQTLASIVQCSGIGLHTGCAVNMQIHPASVDAGICFLLSQKTGEPVKIEVKPETVLDVGRGTRIGHQQSPGSNSGISTVEHLLAAFSGLGIDNAIVELSGPEIPAMDGSAAGFVRMLQQAGIAQQETPVTYLQVTRELHVTSAKSTASFLPCDGFALDIGIDYGASFIGSQLLEIELNPDSFAKELAPARTFALQSEVDALLQNGQAKGGDLSNCILVGENGVLNPKGLRFKDEFVRHKTLDAIGDLSFMGRPILGLYRARRAGHHLNHKAVRELLARPDHYELIDFA